MNKNHYCIIMAGGVGSRFWPLSRASRPKQFLDILDLGRTFLQMTFDRYASIVPKENILVVTAERYLDYVKEQLPEISMGNILLEPFKRNTAPCIAYATYKILSRNPNAVAVVAPSDHLITGEKNFEEIIQKGLKAAGASDKLFTIGIHPTRPETNYGYIQANKTECDVVDGKETFQVKTFTEKPDVETAKVFIETGEFFWNSGMFIWRLDAIKEELERCLPEVTTLFRGGEEFYYTESEADFIRKVYEDCPAISVDYGVMEKTRRAWVFPSNFGWSDVGTWGSIYENSPNKTPEGNVVKSQIAMVDGVRGSIIKEDDPKKLVVVRDVEDVMIVDVKDVLMVCKRTDKTVKDIITDLTVWDKEGRYL